MRTNIYVYEARDEGDAMRMRRKDTERRRENEDGGEGGECMYYKYFLVMNRGDGSQTGDEGQYTKRRSKG